MGGFAPNARLDVKSRRVKRRKERGDLIMLEDLTGSCSLDHRYLGKVSDSAFAIPSRCGVLAGNGVLPNGVKGCGKVTQIVRISGWLPISTAATAISELPGWTTFPENSDATD